MQKLLTHKDPRMTQRYAHLRDETLKKASSVADTIIKRTVTKSKRKKVAKLKKQIKEKQKKDDA